MHFIAADLSMAEPWEELALEDVLEGFDWLLSRHAAFARFLEATGRS